MANPLSTTRSRDEVSLLVDGTEFRGWTKIALTLSLDTIATLSFLAPFNPDDPEHRDKFRPFSFKPLEVLVGGERLFKGTLVNPAPQLDANSNTVQVEGYSLPGVLTDCEEPISAFPFELNKLTLAEILRQVARPFSLDVKIEALNTGRKFEKVALDPEKKPFGFLTDLARQRNFVLSNTVEGALLCWRSTNTGSPVAEFDQRQPTTKVTAEFFPREYFSEVTGITPTKAGRRGKPYTERNPWLPGVLRPKNFKLDDIPEGGADEAVRAELGRMYGNSAAYTVEEIPTWRDQSGDLFRPNTTVNLTAPGVMVYEKTEMLVRHVHFVAEPEVSTTALNLVLPGAFSGEQPERAPWDEPSVLRIF